MMPLLCTHAGATAEKSAFISAAMSPTLPASLVLAYI
jgi:hypothetical protein